ncbi:flavin-containing monooxygenase [Nocardia sp. NPDC050175]|uniref:flavin-containing monooxygenase n=1 Tax=Nocardia sp. NPDC050175 TaxID=3364317 RepID=UPI0037A1F4C7
MTTDSTKTQTEEGEQARGRVHRTRVLIIGAGFSGMGMAIQLGRRGRRDFLVLEKATEYGGTWRENTYPGCACDIPSHMYSFSFEPNPHWSKMWSGQEEILEYLKGRAAKHNLRANTHFGKAVHRAAWDEATQRWHVRTEQGDEYIAQFLVSGIGGLHVPNTPKLAGIERFSGTTFHSAQWNHEYDLRGKRVAVIGTGASAIQFVPEIVDDVAELHLYQRTPPWVLPRTNITIPPAVRTLFSAVPATRRVARDGIYWSWEAFGIGLNGHTNLMKPLEQLARRNIERSIKDPELARKLVPDYRIGCKRILGSNDYYPALAKPHSTVITEGIAEVTERGIISADGVEREVDAIIYGTGFEISGGFHRLDVVGLDGGKLAEQWAEHGMETHLGITVAGFPNAFFLLGPNTGLGHNSVIFMIEQQIKYAMDAMALVERSGVEALTVRRAVQDRFNDEIQRKLNRGVWSTGGCQSWYLDAAGVNRTVWPGFTWEYWLQTRRVEPADFELLGSVQLVGEKVAAR